MRRHGLKFVLQVFILVLFSCFKKALCNSYTKSFRSNEMEPEPLQPVNPSPMLPFTYNGIPKLSGHCSLNFSSVESILRVTAKDCWSPLAPYLANVICCPQLEASLVILLGQSKKLMLNHTEAKHCLSDVQQILISQGANENLTEICSVYPSDLTESSCPLIHIHEIETIIDISTLLASCKYLDPAIECCNHVCRNSISDAAEKIALRSFSKSNVKTGNSTSLIDCERIVIRWLASKLGPSSANKMVRGLSSCEINKECPLALPEVANLKGKCGNVITNETSCCISIENYMSSLQEQSFITNLQAISCATGLAIKLQHANISSDIYKLCHVKLKDFSLQADSKDSGCLLPSLPSDVTYDNTSGIGFICDLNNNIGAPWHYGTPAKASSCNKTIGGSLPEQPRATSDQNGKKKIYLILASVMILNFLV